MGRSGTVILGILLIILGLYLLLAEYGLFASFYFSWPIILVIIGIGMVAAYYISKPRPGYLRGGNILIMLGFCFYYLHYAKNGSNNSYDDFWPLIVIAVGLGLLLSGIMRREDTKMVSTGLVIIGIGVIFLVFRWSNWSMNSERDAIMVVALISLLLGIKFIIDFILKKKVAHE